MGRGRGGAFFSKNPNLKKEKKLFIFFFFWGGGLEEVNCFDKESKSKKKNFLGGRGKEKISLSENYIIISMLCIHV